MFFRMQLAGTDGRRCAALGSCPAARCERAKIRPRERQRFPPPKMSNLNSLNL